jgi:hypothetical protein
MMVNTVAPDLNKVYMVDAEGNSASQGFAPARYFRPNNNFVVVKGSGRFSDSFNPYGAFNLGEAIFLGAINRFISGFGRPRKRNDPDPQE